MGKSNWNQCGKKHRYRDEHTVNYYKKMYERQRGRKLDYYWCSKCNGYHLTSEEFRPEGYGIEMSWLDSMGLQVVGL
ncbi:MAG: hypothetical protein MJ126_10600 [Lachnospiraceae bacterium]|nr:hypothetical protein [Lachnospiraceae bacterium]